MADRCIECGMDFRDPDDPADRREESDCPTCHKCYSCCTPDCATCGNGPHDEEWAVPR